MTSLCTHKYTHAHTHRPTVNCHLFYLPSYTDGFHYILILCAINNAWPMPNGFNIVKNTGCQCCLYDWWLLIMLLEPCIASSFSSKTNDIAGFHNQHELSLWVSLYHLMPSLLHSIFSGKESIASDRSLAGLFTLFHRMITLWLVFVSSLKKERAISTMTGLSVYSQRH